MMTEIPMNEGGTTSGSIPNEVRYAALFVLIESIIGAIIGGVEYYIWENPLSLLGAVLAIIGFWLYTQLLHQDYSAWNMAVIFNILAIFLYLAGENYPGVILSIFCFFYLVNPGVKQHFQR